MLQFCFVRNKAIADYLASNGYTGTLAEFQKEADMVCIDMQKNLYACMECILIMRF